MAFLRHDITQRRLYRFFIAVGGELPYAALQNLYASRTQHLQKSRLKHKPVRGLSPRLGPLDVILGKNLACSFSFHSGIFSH